MQAIGVAEDLAHTSIRFGIGRFTTEAEIDFALGLLKRESAAFDQIKKKKHLKKTLAFRRLHVHRLREMSPLWELVQEGVDLSTIEWTQDAAHHH